jgi:hypothetical protein
VVSSSRTRSNRPCPWGSRSPTGDTPASRYPIPALPRSLQNKKPRCRRVYAVARPGLEPGTPRFSVVRVGAARGPQIPGSYVVSAGVRRSQDVRSSRMFIAVCGNGWRLRPRFGTRAVWAASGFELERGFAACGLRRRSPIGTETLGGSARFSVKAGTNAASAPTTVSRPGRASGA